MWHVYICNRRGRLYTGITTDLAHRMKQHHATLLYSEPFDDKRLAAQRERQIKGWRREKRLKLIRKKWAVSLSPFALLRASSLYEGSPCWGAIRHAKGHTTKVDAPFRCSWQAISTKEKHF